MGAALLRSEYVVKNEIALEGLTSIARYRLFGSSST
jgi:hypothetical protein